MENLSGQTALVKWAQLFQLKEMILGKLVSAHVTTSVLRASVNTAVLFWNPTSSQTLKAWNAALTWQSEELWAVFRKMLVCLENLDREKEASNIPT